MLLNEVVMLHERNIINMELIDFAVKTLQNVVTKAEHKQWFQSNFRKWLINEYPRVKKIIDWNLPGPKPSWFDKAKASGQELYKIDFSPAASEEWRRLATAMAADMIPGNLSRMSVPDALTKAKQVTKDSRRKHGRAEGKVVHTFKDGWSIVWLNTVAALKHEGCDEEMNHCVGKEVNGHPRKMTEGRSRYYSLRNPKGGSHVTMEVDVKSQEFVAAYGKSNSKIKEEYKPYVLEFAKTFKIGGDPFAHRPRICTMFLTIHGAPAAVKEMVDNALETAYLNLTDENVEWDDESTVSFHANIMDFQGNPLVFGPNEGEEDAMHVIDIVVDEIKPHPNRGHIRVVDLNYDLDEG